MAERGLPPGKGKTSCKNRLSGCEEVFGMAGPDAKELVTRPGLNGVNTWTVPMEDL